jgi:hypothetical protein
VDVNSILSRLVLDVRRGTVSLWGSWYHQPGADRLLPPTTSATQVRVALLELSDERADGLLQLLPRFVPGAPKRG